MDLDVCSGTILEPREYYAKILIALSFTDNGSYSISNVQLW